MLPSFTSPLHVIIMLSGGRSTILRSYTELTVFGNIVGQEDLEIQRGGERQRDTQRGTERERQRDRNRQRHRERHRG